MWFPSTPNLKAGQVEEAIKNSSVVIIHAWASWNQSDRAMDKILSDLAPLFSADVKFYSMDIDWAENFEFLHQHKVVNVPALVCFKNGQHVETVIGLHTKQVLFDTIKAVST